LSENQPKIFEVLNQLLNGEMHAVHLYYQAAAWSADRNLDGCMALFMGHAGEELTHMRRFLDYMIDIDCPAVFTALPAPAIPVDTVPELMEMVLNHEMKVTANIDKAVKAAQEGADHSTFEFLQWFVKEQREEEKLYRDIIRRVSVIGDGPHTLYFIDKEVGEVALAQTGPAMAVESAMEAAASGGTP